MKLKSDCVYHFRLIWDQTGVRLVTNQPGNVKYNLISVWFNKIPKIFLCVHKQNIFSESRKSMPNFDCNRTFPIDLLYQTQFRWVLNLSVKCNYNPNLVLMNAIRKIFLRVQELLTVSVPHTNRFPFPCKSNGIWSWRQFSFRFWAKLVSIWFKIERKTVSAIIFHSILKWLEI